MVDDVVGSILVALRELGLEENTIVIFLSDHGDLMGDFGLLFKGPYHYQALIRVPLIWADGRSPAARRHPGHVSTIDVAASMLQSAGVAPFNGMHGRPFVDDGGEPATARDCVLVEDEVQTLLPGSTVRGRVRTLLADGWRMSVYDGIDQGELYNLDEDPEEAENPLEKRPVIHSDTAQHAGTTGARDDCALRDIPIAGVRSLTDHARGAWQAPFGGRPRAAATRRNRGTSPRQVPRAPCKHRSRVVPCRHRLVNS